MQFSITATDLGQVRKRGVYGIVNAGKGRIYVGAAHKSFMHRWEQHLSGLRSGSHVNTALLTDWRECGADAFTFHILAIVDRGTRQQALFSLEKTIMSDMEQRYTLYNVHGYPMRFDPDAELINATEFARRMNVSLTSIRRYVLDGKLTAYSNEYQGLKPRPRFLASDVDRIRAMRPESSEAM